MAVVIALPPFSNINQRSSPLVISDGLHFVCDVCAKKIISRWDTHNNGRFEQYLIKCININVQADTKKDFANRVLPQIISQFKNILPHNWYIPKTDINNALRNNLRE